MIVRDPKELDVAAPSSRASLWLLCSPLLGHLTAPFVTVTRERTHIDWESLLDASRMWSSGERRLVALAINLWSGLTASPGDDHAGFGILPISPYEWAELDDAVWRRVMEALAMKRRRRISLTPEER